MSEAEAENRNNRRALWPWVVAALVLCVAATGWSVWWPTHQMQQLVQYARENEGAARINYHHPAWMKRFFAEDTFLPHYDELYCYWVDNPISNEQLRTLPQCEDLTTLVLDISKCSNDKLAPLENCRKLQRIILIGRREPIPLDWMTGFGDLNACRLLDISVSPDRWSDLLKLPNMTHLKITDTMADLNHVPGARCSLNLSRNHLTRTEAEGIMAIRDLTGLTLEYSSSTPEFWETLGRHQTLEVVTIKARSAASPLLLSGTELEPLQEISSLRELRLLYSLKKSIELETDSRKQFTSARPDVWLIRHSVTQFGDER